MENSTSSYRQIFKATSLFGGVQVFQIFISIIRTKFVAILLGTAGVGIMGLFNAPLQLILSITGLGITFSAVREISEAYEGGDNNRLKQKVTTLRRWSWVAGFFGMVVTILFAPLLSKWTFGDKDYTWAFIWLSLTLLFQTISNSQRTVIQATRRLNDLAKASVYGSIAGLFTAIPLYYFFELKGIVPSLIMTSLISFLLTWHFSRRMRIKSVYMSPLEIIRSGKNMIMLGLIITMTGVVGFLTGYILNAFISRSGGVDQVGLYNAGWSIIGQSTGLVFAAMTTDYYPRLSAINRDEIKTTLLVNQQAEMVLLILAPIITSLILLMPIIIRLLYTPAFLPVVTYANWLLVGVLFKGLVWPIGFIFPAKGDFKSFGIIEIVSMGFNIIINITGYYLFGLVGLGITFVLGYILGYFITRYFSKKMFGFIYTRSTVKTFLINLFFVIMVFAISYSNMDKARYAFGGVVLILSIWYSFTELDKRLQLKPILNEQFKKLLRKQ